MQFGVWFAIINQVFKDSKCANIIKSAKGERVRLAIANANNHYGGSGPRTMNIFRNMLGLPQAEWKDMKKGGKTRAISRS